jgi:ADP-heptose:LPS heptosyltransferase
VKALVVRLDGFGDVLLAGPAVRAVAAHCSRVTMLCGPRGEPAARLLPGVDDVIVWAAPREGAGPSTVAKADVDGLVRRLGADAFDVALVFAPVVPAERWGPYGVPSVLLGDQVASGAGSRARHCPVPGHPCLDEVTGQDVLRAVQKLLKDHP